MVEFKVRAESLEDVSLLLQMVISTFDLQMSHVDGTVKSVVNGSWRGADADTFMDGWKAFEESSAQVRLSLEGLAGALRNSAMTYNLTEASVKSSVTPSGGSK